MLVPVSVLAASPATNALPQGGVTAAGQAAVTVNGAQMTVTQTTAKAILNWQGFDIGSQAGVTFVQPSASAIALNRVSSADPSQILGSLKANGQLVLINPAGVVFGGGSTVNVGGLVASTLNLADQDFLSGNLRFARSGKAGSIDNQGTLQARDGGYIALVAPTIRNSGLIEARFGSVALAAGDVVTLAVSGQALLGVTVDPATVQTQIDAGGVIRAPGGKVMLTAQGANALYGGAINANGVIEADTLNGTAGAVTLTASGDLDISGAAISALGGRAETSAKGRVTLGGAVVKAADWLVDPNDLTIDTAAASTIDTALASGNVTLQTTSGAASFTGVGAVGVTAAGVGDIVVAAPLAWTSNRTLTLDAYHGVTVNAPITASGLTAGLALKTNDGGTGGQLTFNAPVTLPATGSVTINSAAYTLINSAAGLQAIGATGKYALVAGVDLSSTSGFTPRGGTGFTGVLEGLGNTINGLTITGATVMNVGLFGVIGVGGVAENLHLTGASISQLTTVVNTGTNDTVGILAGEVDGTVHNVSTAGAVTAGGFFYVGAIKFAGYGGGLTGMNTGTIDHSSSSATVNGSATGSAGNNIGGLVGDNYSGTISYSYATGAVVGGPGGPSGSGIASSGGYAGGLVGLNQNNTGVAANAVIINSYATGSATGGSSVGTTTGGGGGAAGGLAGQNSGQISGSYATGAALGGASNGKGVAGVAGGLIGFNSGSLGASYATGAATGGAGQSTGAAGGAGGLIGYNDGDVIDTYATGLVTGGLHGGVHAATGGLVATGIVGAGSVYGNYWDITTTGQTTDLETGHVNTSGPPSVKGLTTVQWLTQGPGVAGSASGWDFTGVWLQGYPYPVLRALPYIVVSASAAGTYGGTLAINTGVTAADQNGANALSLLNIGGLSLIGGSTGAVGTQLNLGARGALATASVPYQIAYAPISATVNPATLTFTVANASSTYGTLATVGAATLTGFVGGDGAHVVGTVNVYSGSTPVTLAALTSAGGYSEIVTGLTGSAALNYVIAGAGNAAGTLTINPLAVILTGSRTYDGSVAIAGGALSVSNLIGGDSLTLGGSATLAAKDAGAQAIASASGLTLSNANYTVTGGSGSVTINPLAVILTGSRTYDGSAAIAGGALSVSNLIGGDSLTLGGGVTLAAKDAGLQAIASTSGLTLSNANYTATGGSGSVTISPLAVTLTGSRTYDADTDAAAAILDIANNLDGAALTLTGSGVLSSRHAGSSSLTSTGGVLTGLALSGSAAGDYTLTGGSGRITVVTAPLTITASDATINAGDSLPAFVPRFTGLVGDNPSVVQGLILVTTAQTSVPGVYAITPQGGTAQDYAITYVTGALTVQAVSPPPPAPTSVPTPPVQAGTILTNLGLPAAGSGGLSPFANSGSGLPLDSKDNGAIAIGSLVSVDGLKTGGVLMVASDLVGGSGVIEGDAGPDDPPAASDARRAN